MLGRRKVAKHFRITIGDDDLTFARDHAAIAAEAALDGFYVLRTSVPAAALDTADTVRAYKSLARSSTPSARSRRSTSRSARCSTGPPRGCAPTSSSACSPTTWNGTCARRWRRCCSTTTTAPPPRPQRTSPVAKAKPSPAARRKAQTKRTDDGLAVHSLRSLLADLATLTRNTVRFGRDHTTTLLATPTEIQRRALQLLDVQPAP